LEWDEASQTYSVTSPDVPELFTFGRDLEETQHNVREAIGLLLSVLDERGEPRPAALQPVELEDW
jgi:predicted RNase H-like HicB family nuclease